MAATLLRLFTVWCSLISCACAARILLLPINVNSHIAYFVRLGEALRWNNHQVTIAIGAKTIRSDVLRNSRMRIEYYNMSTEPIFQQPRYPSMIVSNVVNYSFRTKLELFKVAVEGVENECSSMLSDQLFQERVQRHGYDLVITDTYPCFNVQPYKMGVPFVTLAAECSFWSYRLPYVPSYVPFFLSSFSDKMTLSQRVANFLMYLAFTPMMMLMDRDDLVRMHAPDRAPMTYSELSHKSQLCLTLRDITVDPAKPRMPNIIEATGLLMVPPNPLPRKLDQFMNGSRDGVIVVSFGSWLDYLPPSVTNTFMSAFGNLSQRVIWKYNGPQPEGVPGNVMLLPWLPQNDLLAHPNTKLFITHCGISSMIEFVYHGVPIIAAPLFSDQHYNAGISSSKGYGKVIDVGKVSTEQLRAIIHETIRSDTYRKSVQKASRILKLEKKDGASRPVFWIEYVLKHGSDHLHSHAYKLRMHELYMLDVICIITTIIAAILFTCCYSCSCVIRFTKRSCSRAYLKEKIN